MTSDEVLAALRCCASGSCDGCPLWGEDPESPVWKNIEPDCLSIAQRVKPKEGKSDDK